MITNKASLEEDLKIHDVLEAKGSLPLIQITS